MANLNPATAYYENQVRRVRNGENIDLLEAYNTALFMQSKDDERLQNRRAECKQQK
jgi:hypothetical protein